MKKRILIIAGIMTLLLGGCGALKTEKGNTQMKSVNLMENIAVDSIGYNIDLNGDVAATVTDFSVHLLWLSLEEDKNTLISPLSILSALSMTANGADNETLAQMEKVFGASVDDLNRYFAMLHFPTDDKYKLSIANAIWFNDDEGFTVNDDFIQETAKYYDAAAYQSAFDERTKNEINNWVNENTDGMIDNILDDISPVAVMYLVNALAFDAEWQSIYYENQVHDAEFTKEDGSKTDIELMYCNEYQYLETQDAQGFIKYYKDKKYAFAALLPNEGVSLENYVASLSGGELRTALTNPTETKVETAIPKFESTYTAEMQDIFKIMGMTDAFEITKADFSKLGTADENIFISRVLHKTFVAVDERGTRAGAATIVEAKSGSAMMPEEPKRVYLDRPFMYMIIDCEYNLPIFIGVVVEP